MMNSNGSDWVSESQLDGIAATSSDVANIAEKIALNLARAVPILRFLNVLSC